MKIALINNSLGNMGSVLSALSFYKYEVTLADNIETIKDSDLLILAGVGNFRTAVKKLKELNFWDIINEEVIDNEKPLLGICLGMQLFADVSYEDGVTSGFGWINGEIHKLPEKKVRVPHMGWNLVESFDHNPIFEGLRYHYFYYMHSYHFKPKNEKYIIASTKYGEINIVAAIRKKNIIGVQFHPEKSQGDGLRLFKNILKGFV